MSLPDPLIALVECLLVNGVVALGCRRFAVRRWSAAAVLEVGLLFYAVQYVAVGLAGVSGLLTWPVVGGVAVLLAAVLAVGGGGGSGWVAIGPVRPSVGVAAALFGLFFVGAYVWFSRFTPIPANDALTYHFPAAVLWLQMHRLSLLPTWFFNPANTYSPLAGSVFIAWLMLPFQSDTLARFVEVPVLLMVGLSIYAIARQLAVDRRTACLLTAAAMISRPFLHQVLLGEDDLFVDLFFLTAVRAALPPLLGGRCGAVRLGMAIGLLLATKYTALLSLPLLLLTGNRAWTARRGAVVCVVAGLLAGPWYLRNVWLTGNPVFPMAAPWGMGRALFTSAASGELRSIVGVWNVLTASQGMPPVLLVGGGVAVTGLIVVRRREWLVNPLLRTVALGPVVGIVLFVAAAPFPEARFVQPEFALGFAAAGAALMAVRTAAARDAIAGGALVVALLTTIRWPSIDVTVVCGAEAMAWTGIAMWVVAGLHRWPAIRWPTGAVALLLLAGYTFVFWDAYVRDCGEMRLAGASPWPTGYPREAPLWAFVNDRVPAGSTIAYTNTYLIYPLQGRDLSHRVVYAPTRAGVHGVADLPWLGSHLSGEALVVAADRATVAEPDRAVWMTNLRQSDAGYLVVMTGGIAGEPPESKFAAEEPTRFGKLFESAGGAVYSIKW